MKSYNKAFVVLFKGNEKVNLYGTISLIPIEQICVNGVPKNTRSLRDKFAKDKIFENEKVLITKQVIERVQYKNHL